MTGFVLQGHICKWFCVWTCIHYVLLLDSRDWGASIRSGAGDSEPLQWTDGSGAGGVPQGGAAQAGRYENNTRLVPRYLAIDFWVLMFYWFSDWIKEENSINTSVLYSRRILIGCHFATKYHSFAFYFYYLLLKIRVWKNIYLIVEIQNACI